MSQMTTSTAFLAAKARPAVPLDAAITVKPPLSKAARCMALAVSESSMTSALRAPWGLTGVSSEAARAHSGRSTITSSAPR